MKYLYILVTYTYVAIAQAAELSQFLDHTEGAGIFAKQITENPYSPSINLDLSKGKIVWEMTLDNSTKQSKEFNNIPDIQKLSMEGRSLTIGLFQEDSKQSLIPIIMKNHNGKYGAVLEQKMYELCKDIGMPGLVPPTLYDSKINKVISVFVPESKGLPASQKDRFELIKHKNPSALARLSLIWHNFVHDTYWKAGNTRIVQDSLDKLIPIIADPEMHTFSAMVPKEFANNEEGHKLMCWATQPSTSYSDELSFFQLSLPPSKDGFLNIEKLEDFINKNLEAIFAMYRPSQDEKNESNLEKQNQLRYGRIIWNLIAALQLHNSPREKVILAFGQDHKRLFVERDPYPVLLPELFTEQDRGFLEKYNNTITESYLNSLFPHKELKSLDGYKSKENHEGLLKDILQRKEHAMKLIYAHLDK